MQTRTVQRIGNIAYWTNFFVNHEIFVCLGICTVIFLIYKIKDKNSLEENVHWILKQKIYAIISLVLMHLFIINGHQLDFSRIDNVVIMYMFCFIVVIISTIITIGSVYYSISDDYSFIYRII